MVKKFKKICVVGLGYVGLPLSLQFARSGVFVLGLDLDSDKVKSINAGKSYLKHFPSEKIAEQVNAGFLEATSDPARLSEVEAILICVPTPLNAHREPDLSFVLDTAENIAPHIPSGALVTLESTTYPGTTEGELRSVLEKKSAMKAGVDFHLAYSPEREDPGRSDACVKTIPKVVGGLTTQCAELAEVLYGQALDTIHRVSSCSAAEATKLLENIFRSVNIALVNELKVVYEAMDIDVHEVINAAATKPFGFMAFKPGPGLGGHCIPIDPHYLSWKLKTLNYRTRFIELADEVNSGMPDQVVRLVVDALNEDAKALRGSKVMILGVAYKPDITDCRESPALPIFQKLESGGALVSYQDNFVPEFRLGHGDPSEVRISKPLCYKSMVEYDCVVIVTHHDYFDGEAIVENCRRLVDTRNLTKAFGTASDRVIKL